MKRVMLWGFVLVMLGAGVWTAQAQQLLLPPTPTPIPPVPVDVSPAPTVAWPVTMSTNLIGNMYFEENDFGLIQKWSQTGLDLRRWYLVQNFPPGQPGTQWTDRVDLSAEGRGYVLRSIDDQNCDSYCSSEAVQVVAAEQNTFYVLMAYARVVQGPSPALYLDFLDANFQRIEVYTQGGYGEQWSRQIVAATAPPGTRYIRVILYIGNATKGTAYWDYVALHSLSAALVPPQGMPNVAAEKPVIARGGGVTYPDWGNANDQADYNTTTRPNGGRWGNQTNIDTFETVDLGKVYTLGGVGYSLDWDGAFRNPLTFQVDVSLDNATWTMVAQVIHQPLQGNTGSTHVEVELPITPIAARYVRYSEPADGEWNGWGTLFYLGAYTTSAEPVPVFTPTPVMPPTPTPILLEPPTLTPTLPPMVPGAGSVPLPVEVLTVPFDRLEPTYTQAEYAGKVILVMAGTGQAAGSSYSDAFYLYTDASGRPLEIPQTEMFDLELDGQRAIYTLGLTGSPPPYNPAHVYAVTYDVGPQPRQIAFRISDQVVGDNSGQFTITVIQAQ